QSQLFQDQKNKWVLLILIPCTYDSKNGVLPKRESVFGNQWMIVLTAPMANLVSSLTWFMSLITTGYKCTKNVIKKQGHFTPNLHRVWIGYPLLKLKTALNSLVRIPCLEIVCYSLDKLSSKCPIYHTMVITVRQEHFVTNSNKVSLRCFNNCRNFSNSTQGKYSHLRLIDDWSAHNASKSTHISHRIRTLGNFIRFEFVSSSSSG